MLLLMECCSKKGLIGLNIVSSFHNTKPGQYLAGRSIGNSWFCWHGIRYLMQLSGVWTVLNHSTTGGLILYFVVLQMHYKKLTALISVGISIPSENRSCDLELGCELWTNYFQASFGCSPWAFIIIGLFGKHSFAVLSLGLRRLLHLWNTLHEH